MKRVAIAVLLISLAAWSQETKRPTSGTNDATAAAGCGSATVTDTAPSLTNFYDSSASTYSTLSVAGDGLNTYRIGALFGTWQAASGNYSSLTLKVVSQCTISSASGKCHLSYSTDSGSTWIVVYATTTSRALTTDSVTLTPSQPMENIRVRVCAYSSATGDVSLDGYDIWTEGVLGASKQRFRIFSTE